MNEYPILIFWSDEVEADVSVVPDLRGCSASGLTGEETATAAKTAMRLWLEVAREEGHSIPLPTVRPALCAAASR